MRRTPQGVYEKCACGSRWPVTSDAPLTHPRTFRLLSELCALRPLPSTFYSKSPFASLVAAAHRIDPRVPPPITLDGYLLWRSPTRVTLLSLRWTFISFPFCTASGTITTVKLLIGRYVPRRLQSHVRHYSARSNRRLRLTAL